MNEIIFLTAFEMTRNY